MRTIEVVLKSGTRVSVEEPAGKLAAPVSLVRDTRATVFAITDEWHIYDVEGVLLYVKAGEDR